MISQWIATALVAVFLVGCSHHEQQAVLDAGASPISLQDFDEDVDLLSICSPADLCVQVTLNHRCKCSVFVPTRNRDAVFELASRLTCLPEEDVSDESCPGVAPVGCVDMVCGPEFDPDA